MSLPNDPKSVVNHDLIEDRFRESELGTEVDVTKLHGAILREMGEPSDGHEPIGLWVVGSFALLALFCGVYLGLYAGGFDSTNYFFTPGAGKPGGAGPVQVSPFDRGKKLYTANCVSCHQATGLGQAGQFPPLDGSEWVIGDAPNRLIAILLHGLNGNVTVKGEVYNGAMAAWESTFKDEDIAAILTYIRGAWSNKASPVPKEAVALMREKTKAQKGTPYTAAQLLAMPPDSEILKLGGGDAAPAGGDKAAAPKPK